LETNETRQQPLSLISASDNTRLNLVLHENSAHCFRMKNITFSADEDLIERARLIAREQRRTLNEAFREWLAQFTQSAGDAQGFDALMARLQNVDAGRRFSRDELNER
jgi:predicted transcriptional regulator